jgi:hypothetical protein
MIAASFAAGRRVATRATMPASAMPVMLLLMMLRFNRLSRPIGF